MYYTDGNMKLSERSVMLRSFFRHKLCKKGKGRVANPNRCMKTFVKLLNSNKYESDV